jgi:hypothetical protein
MAGSILNKRNAVIGWVVWSAGKSLAKHRARQAVPAVEGGRPNKPAIAAAVAGLTGVLMFWRRLRRSSGTDAEE